MTKKWNKMLDRLEKRAGEIKSLEIKLAEQEATNEQYCKWWLEEQEKVTKLESDVADLKAKLALTPAERIVADAAEAVDEILNDEVSR